MSDLLIGGLPLACGLAFGAFLVLVEWDRRRHS